MGKGPKMPPRVSGDGAISVRRPEPGRLLISVIDDGNECNVDVSDHNAWRLFGMLAFMLGIKLPDSIAKAIKF
jgi:hypothetical protein